MNGRRARQIVVAAGVSDVALLGIAATSRAIIPDRTGPNVDVLVGSASLPFRNRRYPRADSLLTIRCSSGSALLFHGGLRRIPAISLPRHLHDLLTHAWAAVIAHAVRKDGS